ncbi:MAG: PaaI family thioesterase, partial [Gluconacetobacter diazotrophicus]|nr:PaaI family thioesterase [Gluconacetobacter diazotrophicus]
AGLLDEQGRPTLSAVTVMLNIGYSAGIAAGRVVAEGRIIGGGRKIYLAEGKVIAADGTLVATAQGTFRRVPKEMAEPAAG